MERYNSIGVEANGFRNVRCAISNKWGFVDSNNNETIPCIYEWVGNFNEYGIVTVRLNNNFGLINQRGDEIVPCIYDVIPRFNGELVPVRLKRKWGIMDKTGAIVIPCIYGGLALHKDGLFKAYLNNTMLCIDRSMNYYYYETSERIPCEECPYYNDKMLTLLCCKFEAYL